LNIKAVKYMEEKLLNLIPYLSLLSILIVICLAAYLDLMDGK